MTRGTNEKVSTCVLTEKMEKSIKERMTEKDVKNFMTDRSFLSTCFVVCFVFAFLILQLNEKHCLHDLKDI